MPKRVLISENQLIKKDSPPQSIQNMIGKTFSRLFVDEYAGFKKLPSGSNYHYVWCSCSCGKRVLGNANHIRFGNWHSCGCLKIDSPSRFKHGFAPLKGKREKIYTTWQDIHKRCSKCGKNDTTRKYSENNIKVCNGWSGGNGFENFKKDMGLPTARTIDRINNELHYSCGHCNECIENGWEHNCRWADDDTQSNNRGNFNNWIILDGIKMTYSQADLYLGFKKKTLNGRVKVSGWAEERAVSTPCNGIIPKKVTYQKYKQ